MAKSKIKKKGIVAISLISVTLLFLVLTFDDGRVIEGNSEIFDSPDVAPVVIDIPDDLKDIDVQLESVLPEQPKLANSDDSLLQQILDGIIPVQQTLKLETVAVTYDVSGNSKQFSTQIPVILQGSVINEGFPVDNIQIAFFAISGDPTVNLDFRGKAEFLLDDKVVGTGDIRFGGTVNQQINIPLLINGRETFDFTFLDEGFLDGSIHTFKVKVSDIKGTFQTSDGTKTFATEPNIANVVYELTLEADEDKIAVVGEDGETILQSKSDSSIVSCVQGAWAKATYVSSNKNTSVFKRSIPSAMNSDIQVFTTSGELVGSVDSFVNSEPPKPSRLSHRSSIPVIQCEKFVGLERNADYVIKIEGKEFPITTPNQQHNYNVDWSTNGAIKIICPQPCDKNFPRWSADASAPLDHKANSNFGFEKP